MSYFGIVVTNGYDWHQCYSWAWEVRTYWGVEKDGRSRSVHKSFPEVDWEEDEVGLMHQCMAIERGLTDRPMKRFFEKRVIVDAGK